MVSLNVVKIYVILDLETMVILIVLKDLHTLELKAKCPKDLCHTRDGSSGYSECSKNLFMLRLGATFIQDVLRTYVTLDLEAVVTLNALRIFSC